MGVPGLLALGLASLAGQLLLGLLALLRLLARVLSVLGSSLVRCLWWPPGGGHDLPAPLRPAIGKVIRQFAGPARASPG
jgi:hypothetical protein